MRGSAGAEFPVESGRPHQVHVDPPHQDADRAALPERWVLHADMDAFYASIEQRDRPELRGKPVIVGGTTSRGVVAAASYEARVFGVRSAMPSYLARQRCPDAVFLPPDMARYTHVSEQVHRVLAEFTPLIEPLALDEAFLDISGSVGLFGGPRALGQRLRARVREEVQLAVSIGIAPNKLVAKIACNLAKPDGLRVVAPHEVRPLLDPLPVGWLWGVGPVLEKTLRDLDLTTLGALADAPLASLQRAVGERAIGLQRLARGEDARPVQAQRAPRSYGEENTFDRDVTERDTVTAALTAHADAVAQRLRRDGYQGRTVTLKVKLARADTRRPGRVQSSEPRYPLLTRSKTLAEATDDAARIRDTAITLWDRARVQVPVRLLGVSVSGLSQAAGRQLELFVPADRRGRVGPALDRITARYGAGTIGPAIDKPHKQSPTDRRKPGT